MGAVWKKRMEARRTPGLWFGAEWVEGGAVICQVGKAGGGGDLDGKMRNPH